MAALPSYPTRPAICPSSAPWQQQAPCWVASQPPCSSAWNRPPPRAVASAVAQAIGASLCTSEWASCPSCPPDGRRPSKAHPRRRRRRRHWLPTRHALPSHAARTPALGLLLKLPSCMLPRAGGRSGMRVSGATTASCSLVAPAAAATHRHTAAALQIPTPHDLLLQGMCGSTRSRCILVGTTASDHHCHPNLVRPACHPRPAAPCAAGAFDDPKQAACGHDIMALRSKGQVSGQVPLVPCLRHLICMAWVTTQLPLTSPLASTIAPSPTWPNGFPVLLGRPPVPRTSTSRCPCTSP